MNFKLFPIAVTGLYLTLVAWSPQARADEPAGNEMAFSLDLKLPGSEFANRNTGGAAIYVQDGKIVKPGMLNAKRGFCSALVELANFTNDPSVSESVNKHTVDVSRSYSVSKRQRVVDGPAPQAAGKCDDSQGPALPCLTVQLAIGAGEDLLKDDASKIKSGYVQEVSCYNTSAKDFRQTFSQAFGALAGYRQQGHWTPCSSSSGNPVQAGMNVPLEPLTDAIRGQAKTEKK
jgi:hypothetical protein